jgi:hypothetical protein
MKADEPRIPQICNQDKRFRALPGEPMKAVPNIRWNDEAIPAIHAADIPGDLHSHWFAHRAWLLLEK